MDSLASMLTAPSSTPSPCEAVSAPSVKGSADRSENFSSVLTTKKLEAVKKNMESETDDEMVSMMVASMLGSKQQMAEAVEAMKAEDADLAQDVINALFPVEQKGDQASETSAQTIPALTVPVTTLQPIEMALPAGNKTAELSPLADLMNSRTSSAMDPSMKMMQAALPPIDNMAGQLPPLEQPSGDALSRFTRMLAEAVQKEAAGASGNTGRAVADAAVSQPAVPSIIRSVEYRAPEMRDISSALLQKIDEAVSRVAALKGRNDVRELRHSSQTASQAAALQGDTADEPVGVLLNWNSQASADEQPASAGDDLPASQRIVGKSLDVEADMVETLFRPFQENLARDLSGAVKDHKALSVEPSLRVQISDLVRQVSGAVEAARGDELITVKLDPPTLGEVSVRVVVENSRMNVQFSVSDRSVKDLIEDNLNSLAQQCAQKGIALGGFSVECRQERNSQDFTPSKSKKKSDEEINEIDGFKSVMPDQMNNLVNVRV